MQTLFPAQRATATLLLLLIATLPTTAQELWDRHTIDDRAAQLTDWLDTYRIPAVGIGVIRDGEIEFSRVFGELEAGRPAPDTTLFAVASLTKPILSMLTLRLVSDGDWDLDEPLAHYWIDPDLAGDPLLPRLTTRHVLNHQTGFNNWRGWNASGRLEFAFAPGDSLQYSGEGFEYLQRALENKFGRSLVDLVDSALFDPLGIEQSALTWQDLPDTSAFAQRHDAEGHNAYGAYRCSQASAAGSLVATVSDYLRFAQSVLTGNGLAPAVRREMIESRVPVRAGLYMGLGWEIAPDLADGAYALIHTGGDKGIRTVVILLPQSGEGLVFFTNSDNGMQLMSHLVPRCLSLGAELLKRGEQ